MRHIVARDPGVFGVNRARWTLDLIRDACPWLGALTRSGVHGRLERLGITWKRGQAHIHSPDQLYTEKRADIAGLCSEARASSGEIALIYLDEVTIYRQPTLSCAYGVRGPAQPPAERDHAPDTKTRYGAGLGRGSGRAAFRRSAPTTVDELVKFYQDLRDAHPEARLI